MIKITAAFETFIKNIFLRYMINQILVINYK